MDLIPYQPFKDFDKWLSRFYDEDWFGFPAIEEPKMDVYETKDKVVAEVEMPGIDPKTIDVSVENNFLKIEGKKEEKKEERKKGYYRKEIRSGYLKRMALLPTETEGGKAVASYEKGLLKVEIPKAKKRKGQKKSIRIKIKK